MSINLAREIAESDDISDVIKTILLELHAGLDVTDEHGKPIIADLEKMILYLIDYMGINNDSVTTHIEAAVLVSLMDRNRNHMDRLVNEMLEEIKGGKQ